MRLIDADALMRDIIKRFGCKPYIEVGNKSEYIHNIIDEQPTAYNPDKVVAELEGLPTKGIDRYKGGSFGKWEGTDYFIDKHKTIDIVRKGGVHG